MEKIMPNSTLYDVISASIEGDAEAASNAFQDVIGQKIMDRIDAKKEEFIDALNGEGPEDDDEVIDLSDFSDEEIDELLTDLDDDDDTDQEGSDDNEDA